MAITVVQHRSTFTNTGVGTTGLTLAFSSNNVAGNLLIASFSVDTGNTVAAPTDTIVNTWSLAATVTGTGGSANAVAYYVKNSKVGANTVKFTWTGSGTAAFIHIWEISGCDTANPLDQTGTVVSSSTASVSTTNPTTNANELVFAFFADSPNSRSLVAGSGYSPSEFTNNVTGGDCAISEVKIVSSTGTQTATITGNSTDVLSQIIATFAQAAAVAGIYEDDSFNLVSLGLTQPVDPIISVW